MEKDEVRACRIEVREQTDGHIKGYPILFNVLSEDLGGFRERILPDAIQFADDLKADFNHNADYILGRTLAGTLKVSTDARGVFMDVTPPATNWARDLMASVKRGDIDQGSFSFRVLPGGQQITEESGQQVRTLSKILVRRVSVVSDPAYTKTSIEVRSKPSHAGGGAPKQAPLSVYRQLQGLIESDL
jgi:HK97 family phage prohead protease